MRAVPLLGFAGANVTLPHKEAALSAVDRVTPQARRIGLLVRRAELAGYACGHAPAPVAVG